MDTKTSQQIDTQDASAGAIPEVDSGSVTMVVCAALVAVCFAAPLFLTLPQAMDAAASPAPVIVETASGAAVMPAFHEVHPVQASGLPEQTETF